jgi:hypothetical protein
VVLGRCSLMRAACVPPKTGFVRASPGVWIVAGTATPKFAIFFDAGRRACNQATSCGNTASRAELAIGPPVEQGSGAWAGPIGDADIRGELGPQGARHKAHSLRRPRRVYQGGCDGDAFSQGDRVAII